VTKFLNYEPPHCAISSICMVLNPLGSKYFPQDPVLKHPQSTFCVQRRASCKLSEVFRENKEMCIGGGGGGQRKLDHDRDEFIRRRDYLLHARA
jgi:hypothetical protein